MFKVFRLMLVCLGMVYGSTSTAMDRANAVENDFTSELGRSAFLSKLLQSDGKGKQRAKLINKLMNMGKVPYSLAQSGNIKVDTKDPAIVAGLAQGTYYFDRIFPDGMLTLEVLDGYLVKATHRSIDMYADMRVKELKDARK